MSPSKRERPDPVRPIWRLGVVLGHVIRHPLLLVGLFAWTFLVILVSERFPWAIGLGALGSVLISGSMANDDAWNKAWAKRRAREGVSPHAEPEPGLDPESDGK